MQEQIIQIGDQSLNYKHYESQNSKGNILILHGWGGKSESWDEVANIISKNDYNVIVPDLPGFGKSTLDKTYTVSLYAELVEKFIATLDIEVDLLLGHSNGGAIATKIVTSNNSPIKNLILNNSAGVRMNGKRKLKRLILKPIAFTFKLFSFLPFYSILRRKIYSFIGSADYVNSEKDNPYKKSTYLNMIGADMTEEFRSIRLRTLLLWGKEDTATPLNDALFMRANIKDSELITIEGQGHSIHLKAAILLCTHILDFLK